MLLKVVISFRWMKLATKAPIFIYFAFLGPSGELDNSVITMTNIIIVKVEMMLILLVWILSFIS